MTQKQLAEHTKSSDPQNALRQIKILVYIARAIARNAAIGQFPKYN